MLQLTVTLAAEQTGTQASFRGWKVSMMFQRHGELAGAQTINVAAEITATVDSANKARFEIPAEASALQGEITLRVLNPVGRMVHQQSVLAAKLPSELTIQVSQTLPATIDGIENANVGKPAKLRGRVLDKNGKQCCSQTQIILWACEKESATLAPIGSACTDGQGYFSTDYPVGEFSKAEATFPHGISAPIHLEENGNFPERLLLVIDALPESPNGSDEDDCNCHAQVPRLPDVEDVLNSPSTYSADLGSGNCPILNMPNRTLEEFDYYSIVRTSDPRIKGLTIDNSAKLSVETIATVGNPKLIEYIGTDGQAPPGKDPANPGTPGRPTRPATASKKQSKSAKNPAASSALAARRTVSLDDEIDTEFDVVLHDDGQPGERRINLPKDTFVDVNLLRNHLRQTGTLTGQDLVNKSKQSRMMELSKLANSTNRSQPSRSELSDRYQIDWDDDPTFYQATEIAHGHLLHFKQRWLADGYSLGDLLYSLPLAPGQKKQIAIIDWERREVGSRTEESVAEDQLAASLTRDRDILEVANSMVAEQLQGGSTALTASESVGLGIAGSGGSISAVIGAAGSISVADSFAFQNSARQAAASSLQQLSDKTLQAASSVRSQRSTVVQTVTQGETVRAETDSVANYNHCHALTMEYFEVLRHFAIYNSLVEVRECLFVPLLMSAFEQLKVLRWRTLLKLALTDRRLLPAFDAVERIVNHYVGADFPTNRFADEAVNTLAGSLTVTFRFSRPQDNEDRSFNGANWIGISKLIGINSQEFHQRFLQGRKEKDRIFQEKLGAQIADAWIRSLKFFAVDEDNREHELKFDVTQVSEFKINAPINLSLRSLSPLSAHKLARKSILSFKVRSVLKSDPRFKNLVEILATGSSVILKSGRMTYQTKHMDYLLFDLPRIDDDITLGDDAVIQTPLALAEMRNPREEDRSLNARLINHLNEKLEYYHRAIWLMMDPQRRYMLLDGVIAPNSDGRSVASVVENRLIGIVGNSMVFPVVPGIHLDTSYQINPEDRLDLIKAYQPDPIPPLRVSLPTKGVFAEAVMGSCNSCEKIDESRFWRWEESPIPDSPTQIEALRTDSRATQAPNLTARDFQAPIINMQNAPAAPDPTGFSSLVQLLSSPDLFRDVSGLTENQKNTLAAMQATLATAQSFGSEANKLAMQQAASRNIDKLKDTLQESVDSGMLTKEQAGEVLLAAVNRMSGNESTGNRIAAGDVMSTVGNVVTSGGQMSFADKTTGQSMQASSANDVLGFELGSTSGGAGGATGGAGNSNGSGSDSDPALDGGGSSGGTATTGGALGFPGPSGPLGSPGGVGSTGAATPPPFVFAYPGDSQELRSFSSAGKPLLKINFEARVLPPAKQSDFSCTWLPMPKLPPGFKPTEMLGNVFISHHSDFKTSYEVATPGRTLIASVVSNGKDTLSDFREISVPQFFDLEETDAFKAFLKSFLPHVDMSVPSLRTTLLENIQDSVDYVLQHSTGVKLGSSAILLLVPKCNVHVISTKIPEIKAGFVPPASATGKVILANTSTTHRLDNSATVATGPTGHNVHINIFPGNFADPFAVAVGDLDSYTLQLISKMRELTPAADPKTLDNAAIIIGTLIGEQIGHAVVKCMTHPVVKTSTWDVLTEGKKREFGQRTGIHTIPLKTVPSIFPESSTWDFGILTGLPIQNALGRDPKGAPGSQGEISRFYPMLD